MLNKLHLSICLSAALFASVASAGPVSLVDGYAGSYLQPGPGYAISYSLPYSSSYSSSQAIASPNYSGIYSVSETASGNLTTASLQISNSYSSDPKSIGYSNFQYVSSNAFSGADLMISGPVYLSESVTVNYSLAFNNDPPGFGEYLGFYDAKNNPLGSGCTVPTAPPSAAGTVSCSTGLVFIGSASEISINSSLGASVEAFSPGDSESFQGIATLGPLDVYDVNGNLIEALDLNGLAAPEPKSTALFGMGLMAVVLSARAKHRPTR